MNQPDFTHAEALQLITVFRDILDDFEPCIACDLREQLLRVLKEEEGDSECVACNKTGNSCTCDDDYDAWKDRD